MSSAVSRQPNPVVLRSQYVQLRAMFVVALVAVVALAATVAILATGEGATSAPAVRAIPSVPQTSSAVARPDGGPDEGAWAQATASGGGIGQSGREFPPADARLREAWVASSDRSGSGPRYDGGPEEGSVGPGR